jgi:fumarate hydratase class II
MLIRKEQDLNSIQTQVFDLLIGYDESEQINKKQHASRRSLEARRAIEKHFEEKQLHNEIDELWFDD